MSCISRSRALFQIRSLASSSHLPLPKLRPSPAIYKSANKTAFNASPSTSQSAITTRGFRSTAAKMTVHNLTNAQDFKDALKSHKFVLVDFFATWCGPCRAIAPKIAEWSDAFPNIHYVKVDVDEVPDVAQEYNVRAMPTFLLFKDGEKVDEVVGANPPKLQALISANHPSS
ncbi:hypothetical protein MCOR02_007459 [Pyricularia oryzae]|uniref:Thioredoxin domain-containing protein n=1 Tax=Pyricularia oryzae TaxID=318829 RepID=A0A4P7NQC3_PYROR|nr:hypothetical protein MCOR02_007459 [Pyricularia oryzae]KAI6454704.1 hypothetical protein MCOR17_008945 [Pyricularia oryzae]KAI6493096.1 hypothetical protein MCOR13_007843 [Pyricularia oryzae]KAI6593275.1 hypothetical protein MCOR04_003353 [Pyricularia oryzae]KAI6598012.1 hypothetical protein MCOR06_001855 [Pyricularia oryzae]